MNHRGPATPKAAPKRRLGILAVAALASILALLGTAGRGPGAAHADPSFRAHDLVLDVLRDGQHWTVQVDMLLYDDGSDPAAAEAASRAAMLARFPGATVIGDSPGGVTAQYVLNPYRWPGQSTTWRYNSSGKPAGLGGEDTALKNAAAAWRNAGVNFSLDFGGATTDNTAGCSNQTDGRNTVGWAPQDGNTLAVTCTWYDGSRVASEFDMQIDPAWDWTTSDSPIRVDLQSVTTHEFGHAIGLAHSNDSSAVMWSSYRNGANKRTLEADDIAGAKAIYGSAPQQQPPQPPTPPPPASLPINPGANLVTWPGADQAPSAAFATAANVVVVVYAYDTSSQSWARFAPGVPNYVNNLPVLKRGAAYWVIAKGAAVITVDQ